MTTPHLVQYQGSKRNIAPEILQYFPDNVSRLIEPFAGTCAVSILASMDKKINHFWINDINAPLVNMMKCCVENPEELYEAYYDIWNGQFVDGEDNITYFYKIRDEFNEGNQDPARMLFLLARVVKGAIRYNNKGQINQSCDKRRYGTKPETIRINACLISNLLKEKTVFSSVDYKEILKLANPGDLVYMDPPYQGTSNQTNQRDNRYIQGVQYEDFVEALEDLNRRNIDFIISYDGMTGDKKIGLDLPEHLNLLHLYINAGTSAQSVLNGNKQTTYESLYLSSGLQAMYYKRPVQLTLDTCI
ncbi:MAG: DNA adenine methylase [Bacteroides thetaiotaomicron]|nr:DNA adenine methylase [Bacteroides thetaiotaomicron]